MSYLHISFMNLNSNRSARRTWRRVLSQTANASTSPAIRPFLPVPRIVTPLDHFVRTPTAAPRLQAIPEPETSPLSPFAGTFYIDEVQFDLPEVDLPVKRQRIAVFPVRVRETQLDLPLVEAAS